MKTFTFVTVLLLAATFAVAGASNGYLTRTVDGVDPDARGTVKVKDAPGAGLFSIKLKKVDRKVTYGLYIEDTITDPDSPLWVRFGETLGSRKWKANTARGDDLPLGAKSVSALAGLKLQVKDGSKVILVGAVPDASAKKAHKQKAKLSPTDSSQAAGDVQLDSSTLRLKVRKFAAGEYDVRMEDDEGEMVDVGDLTVRSNGTGRWRLSAKKGDPLPLGSLTTGEFFGRRFQVTNQADGVLCECTIPGEKTKPGNGGSMVRGPRLRILVTDAPFPYEDVVSAIVSVRRIEIRKVGSPFQTLHEWENGRDLDLVELKNGLVNILYAGDPEPGDYDALRIIVDAKEITIMDGGREHTFTEFKVPSGSQTGIKVFVKPVVTVVTDLTKDVILDIDLEKSFIVQGNPKTPAGIKGFHFKPVVRAVNRTVAGTLTFRVMSDNGTPSDRTDDFYLDGAAYRVTDSTLTPPDDVLASGSSGKDPADDTKSGYVFHPGVVEGTFALTVEYRDHDDHVQRVTIDAGNLTDEGTIVLAATAAYLKGLVTTSIQTKNDGKVTFALADAAVSGTLSGDTTPSASDTTNSMGDYALTDLTFGTWNLTVTKTGYVDGTGSSVAWVPGDPSATDLDIELAAETADVSGVVKDESGTAVSGVTVQVVFTLATTEYLIAETTTDVDGKYSFTALGTAAYDIRASITVSDVEKTGTASVTHVGPTASTADITVK